MLPKAFQNTYCGKCLFLGPLSGWQCKFLFRFSFYLVTFFQSHVSEGSGSQSLALCSSNLAMVPKWTSSGPSAILRVLAVAHRCARTVSEDTPAAPCTCIAMSSTFSAMFGAATCSKTKDSIDQHHE